jgi:hypothetical protein
MGEADSEKGRTPNIERPTPNAQLQRKRRTPTESDLFACDDLEVLDALFDFGSA